VADGSQDCVVQDGRDRLLREKERRERERGVREAVLGRHEARLARTRGAERALAYLRMRREMRRELEALAPRRGWYLRGL
jgi:hypothetical protein